MLYLAIDYSIRSGERSPRYSSRWEGKMIRWLFWMTRKSSPNRARNLKKRCSRRFL